ncbi:tubulin-specific chaperone C-like [Condylostylus longicornis]|uniref:tubulin-specific chaperone C-like n=1 Tax=Condylostylus longicornis TaxID=2530218 RepID=UPI00244DD81A|nr:tubulin-specific chaperone C-like [Condylostylus longicornis]
MASKIRVQVDDDIKIWKFLIEPEWTKIKHLGKYLKGIFNLEKIFILDDDGFLHPNSNISYLHCMAKNNEILTIKSSLNLKNESFVRENSPKRKKPKPFKCQQNENSDLISDTTPILKPEPEKIKQNGLNKLTDRMANFSQILNSFSTEGVLNGDHPKKTNIFNHANEIGEAMFEIPRKRRVRKKKERKLLSPEKSETLRFQKTPTQILQTKNITKSENEKKLNNVNQSKEHDKTHIRFDDSGEAVTKKSVASIIFVDYLDNPDLKKPRDIRPIKVNVNNDNCAGKVLDTDTNISQETEYNSNNSDNKESTTETIESKISAEFLNHKLEKWDDFPNYDANCNSDALQQEIDSNNQEKPKVVVISNEIITNGVN